LIDKQRGLVVAAGVQTRDHSPLALSRLVLLHGERQLLVVESLLRRVCLLLCRLVFGISSDGGVSFGVYALQLIGSYAEFGKARELAFVGVLILFHQVLHIVGHVLAEDVLSVDISAELFRLDVIAGEAFGRVGDINASVGGAFHGAENASAGRRARQTYVQVCAERTRFAFNVLHVVLLARHRLRALIYAVQMKLLQQPTGQQKSSAIRGRIVSETDFDAISGQFVGISGAHNDVALDLRVRDLCYDVFVGEPNDQPILRCIVFILVLHYEPTASVVIGFALSPPLELDLESLEVSLVFHHFYKTRLSHSFGEMSLNIFRNY